MGFTSSTLDFSGIAPTNRALMVLSWRFSSSSKFIENTG
jgi:hypothetical protein